MPDPWAELSPNAHIPFSPSPLRHLFLPGLDFSPLAGLGDI